MRFTLLKQDQEVLMKIGGTIENVDLNNLLEKMYAGLGTSNTIKIDFSKVTEMNTAILQVILAIYKEGVRRSKSIQIVSASQQVTDVFEYLNLSSFLNQKSVGR